MKKIPKEIIKKVLMLELRLLHCACCVMLIDIYLKFLEDTCSLNGFHVTKRS